MINSSIHQLLVIIYMDLKPSLVYIPKYLTV